jgi:hypothetical protein
METTQTVALVTCWKCAGSGVLPYLRHIDNGVCFTCEGTGQAESKPVRRSSVRYDRTQYMRNLYTAATRNDHRGPLTYDEVLDERDGMGWTRAGLEAALDEVPGSREAFRAIGWPV